MRILIAGVGSIGRRHLKNLMALGQRDVLLYRSGKSTLPADEFGGIPTVTDLRAALDRAPDAVIISNPTALHLEVAIPAAEAGCHLLLEKPVSDSMEGMDDLRGAVQRGGSRVLMGFQFRHHPTLRTVKSIVGQGELGRVVSARAHWGERLADWHPWEDYRVSYAARRDLGGGALLTLCHPFDYLRWILGEVVSARGLVGYGMGLEVESVAEAALRFEAGAVAGLHLNYLQRPADHHLEIVGENGRLRWDGWSGDLEVQGTSEGERRQESPPMGFERNDMFVAEMNHFLQVAAGEASPVCTLEDGIRVQEIIERVRQSALADERGVTR